MAKDNYQVIIKNLSADEATELTFNLDYYKEQMKELKELIGMNNKILKYIEKTYPETYDDLTKIKIVQKAKKHKLNKKEYLELNGYKKVVTEPKMAINPNGSLTKIN